MTRVLGARLLVALMLWAALVGLAYAVGLALSQPSTSTCTRSKRGSLAPCSRAPLATSSRR